MENQDYCRVQTAKQRLGNDDQEYGVVWGLENTLLESLVLLPVEFEEVLPRAFRKTPDAGNERLGRCQDV